MTSLTHSDYTVAWICALPLEMAAAKVMLDEIHDPLAQPPADHNAYTLGTLSGHNVVIACLPSGVYGVTSAATVLSQMLPTFPRLQFGLMVGIGGGVPGKSADIRLGDVVVSMPTITSGGVIQYDYGKAIHDGQFQRIGLLNKPPQALLTAVSQMRSNSITGERPIKKIIYDTLKQHREMRKQFSRPDKDWLFHSTYCHRTSSGSNCSACDPTQLVNRGPRGSHEPYIHYGLIASGNQVIKDAKRRDHIAQELGILCFETEAAGLMDQLPCLVIRGICDYCDSHKHKEWQGYAALTAAAYVKTLLIVLPLHHKNDSFQYKKNKEGHWMVPFGRNPRFVGRQDEITKLEELIFQQDGPRKIAITGLGGVGKTQVALELAYRIQDKNADCSVFWIPCTSYESVEQAYTSITQVLGIQGVKPAHAKECVKAYLSQKNAGKWLLIFDNADDMNMWIQGSDTTPALKNVFPQSGQGCILVTTRNRKLAVKLASSSVILIPDMEERTAAMVLEKSLIQKSLLHDYNTTSTLLEQLGFLPLAIAQAAAYINENNIALSDYQSLLEAQEEDTIELLSEDFQDEGRYAEIQNPVATTWLISFQQVQQLDQLAAEYLSFMACINPRNIPKSILPQASSPKRRIGALGLLNAYSFTSEQAGDSSFSLHRLVHLATRNWLRNNGMLNLWTRKTANQLEKVFPNDDHANQALWREYLPHVLFLTDSKEFRNERSKYDKFLLKIGKCLSSDGRYSEAKDLVVDVMEIREKALGPEHPDTLASVSKLGSVLAQQGKYEEAEGMHRRTLEGRVNVLGPEHPDTLVSISELGSALARQGKYEEAEAMCQRLLEGREKVLGLKHPDTLVSVSKLGSVLARQGKYEEAEAMHRRTLEGRVNVLGPEHPDTLGTVSKLGSALGDQGKYEEAEAMQRQALEGREKILGPEHPDTLVSVSELGSVLARQGKYEEAEAMHRRDLKASEKVLGPEHPDTLVSVSELGSVLAQQGKCEEAEAMYRRDLKASEKVLGPEHPDTLVSLSGLGSVLAQQGKYEEAEAMQQRALEGYEKVLGPEHPNTLTSMNNLAYTWKSLGKVENALILMTRCVWLRNQQLGPDHPHTISSSKILRRWHKAHGSSPYKYLAK